MKNALSRALRDQTLAGAEDNPHFDHGSAGTETVQPTRI